MIKRRRSTYPSLHSLNCGGEDEVDSVKRCSKMLAHCVGYSLRQPYEL